jgi:hypothetical protein
VPVSGKVDITSAPDEFPYKWRDERPFVGIHDHVYARALVLDDGQRRVVLALVEVTTLPDPAGIVKAVAQEIGVPEANVLVAASHTHEVPLVFFHEHKADAVHAREIERLTRGTLEAVREANAPACSRHRLPSGAGKPMSTSTTASRRDSRRGTTRTAPPIRHSMWYA